MSYVNVTEPFLESVSAHPDKCAVIFKDEKLSYAELNTYINKTAQVLTDDLGVTSGDRVAYLLPNSIEIIVIYYAIQKIGAVAVPLNFKLIAREVDYLVGASQSKVLLFASQLSDKARQVQDNDELDAILVHIDLDGEVCSLDGTLSFCELIASKKDIEPPLFKDEYALSRVQYTGGSSGVPKGAARTHRADLVEFEGILDSNGLAQDPDNVVLIQCPLEHHGGHSWFTISFIAGATIVICDVFNAETILDRIQKYRVTYMILLPPTTYLRLLDCPTIGGYDLSSVKLVQSSAGATTKEIVAKIYEHFPNAVLNYGWGQSESGLGASLVITRDMLETDSPLLMSVGRPMKGITFKIIDDRGNEVPSGTVGEAIVSSEAVMEGYYGAPELTDEVFMSDGWLRTGDMMKVDEQGYLYVESRKKDMIKSGGENVFVAEVERTICSHPEVIDCVVFGTDDPIMGEAVAAVVQLQKGAQLSEIELQDYCKQYIASYKKPRYVVFIDDIGRNAAGKIRKQNIVDYFNKHKRDLSARPYEQIHSSPDVYLIQVPFAEGLMKSANIYLIKTDDRNVLIDAGTSRERSLHVLKETLRDLKVDMDRTDILLTHFHLDHLGLVRSIARPGTRIYLSKIDTRFIEPAYNDEFQKAFAHRLREECMPQDQIDALVDYSAALFSSKVLPDIEELLHLEDGEHFTVGQYQLEVIDTPGHTLGHQSFYFPATQIMFYGDHVLMNVSPSLTFWPGVDDTLDQYLQSLERIAAYPVEVACMGHGGFNADVKTNDIQKRTEWLMEHHEKRLQEIADYVSEHPEVTGTEIAKNIIWNIPYDSWSEISVMQRAVMVLETIVHLEHLTSHGVIVRALQDGKATYTSVQTK